MTATTFAEEKLPPLKLPFQDLTVQQWRTIAMMRAQGKSWQLVGEALHRPAAELEQIPWECGDTWRRLLQQAREIVDDELLGEALLALRSGLRNSDDRLRIQAANALARIHVCRHPQPKPDKEDQPKPMTERQAQFYREAEFFGNMSEDEYKFRKNQAQRHSFMHILSTICQDRLDLFNQILDVADMTSMGHPRCHPGVPLPSEKNEEGIYGIFSGKNRRAHDRPMRFPDGSIDPALIPANARQP
jgi:hypothetical protein